MTGIMLPDNRGDLNTQVCLYHWEYPQRLEQFALNDRMTWLVGVAIRQVPMYIIVHSIVALALEDKLLSIEKSFRNDQYVIQT